MQNLLFFPCGWARTIAFKKEVESVFGKKYTTTNKIWKENQHKRCFIVVENFPVEKIPIIVKKLKAKFLWDKNYENFVKDVEGNTNILLVEGVLLETVKAPDYRIQPENENKIAVKTFY